MLKPSIEQMRNILKFNPKYFLIAVLIFIAEVLIALFVHDKIVRPYIGDFLVVILIYCFVKSFLNVPVLKTAIGVLLFAFAIETLQYFDLVHKLGLQNFKVARIILGSAFEWTDMMVYTAGIFCVVATEKLVPKNKN